MNTQSFTIFTSLLLLSISLLHAQIPDDWTGGWGDRAKAAIGEYVSDEDIEKAKDSAKKLTKSSRDLYDEFLQEIQDLEIKKIIDPVDEPDDAVVDVIEDDVPEAEEGRVIVADLYDKDRLRDLLEQEFIVANTQKLTIHFKSKSKAQKDALIKSIQKFFAKTYIFKSTRIYSTPKGITISGQWDSAVYLAKAYQGVYPMAKLNEREKEAISLLKKQLPAIIKNKSTDYDKALAIHDWLVTHVNYQKKDQHQTAEQAIVKGYVVCAGYARAYTVMLGAVGIPSTVILGNKHAWNFVRADGKWMHVDVTWDDCHTPDNNNIIYTFFGLNHEEMTLVHSQLRLVVRYLPDCIDSDMSYAFNNFVHTKGIDDLTEVLICTEPDKNEAVRVYFKMPMNKLAFSKAIARATAKGCKYGKISSWSHEELMQKSGIIYFTLMDEDSQQEELNRQKMEAFLNNNF